MGLKVAALAALGVLATGAVVAGVLADRRPTAGPVVTMPSPTASSPAPAAADQPALGLDVRYLGGDGRTHDLGVRDFDR